MYISQHRYTVEQMPDDYGGEGHRGGMTGGEQTMLEWRIGCVCSCNHFDLLCSSIYSSKMTVCMVVSYSQTLTHHLCTYCE